MYTFLISLIGDPVQTSQFSHVSFIIPVLHFIAFGKNSVFYWVALNFDFVLVHFLGSLLSMSTGHYSVTDFWGWNMKIHTGDFIFALPFLYCTVYHKVKE